MVVYLFCLHTPVRTHRVHKNTIRRQESVQKPNRFRHGFRAPATAWSYVSLVQEPHSILCAYHFKGVGHFPYIEAPKGFAAAVKAFVR
jgi:hypothetical protein